MVRIEDVTVTWPEFQLNANLEAAKGEVLSILGPSGSGKTTTLRIIAGFEEAERGRVWVGEREVTRLSPRERKIGFVFQDYTLFPHMNVFDNVAYGLHVIGMDRGEQEERVRRYLELVGLPGFESRRVQTLSGGERQRVAVARALVVEPEVLLLDEPFSSIDAPLRKDLGSQLLKLQRALGITILFVTHSRSEALSISHRVAVMRAGKILQAGTPEELYARPINSFVAGFVGPATFFRGTLERATDSGGAGEGYLRFRSEELERPLLLSQSAISGSDGQDSGAHSSGAPSGAATLMLRPGSVSIIDRAEPPRDSELKGTTLECTIEARQFFGHYFEYECRLAGSSAVTVFDVVQREVGSEHRLLVPPEAPVLLPE